jgi:hypothetical protein
MKAPARARDDAAIVNPLTVDVSCSVCGREPSHPQIRYRFAYAAYHTRPSLLNVTPRTYVAALCEPCADGDRRAGVGTARNRFLALVRQWSGQEANRGQIVRLLENPTGAVGDEREGDGCFCDGELHSYRALMARRDAE